MIKGTSQNIICDACRTIIQPKEFHHTVQGKKRILHYHVICTPFEHLHKINQNEQRNRNPQTNQKA